MTRRSAERTKFLADILTTAIESRSYGVGAWAEVNKYQWSDPTLGKSSPDVPDGYYAYAQIRPMDEPETEVFEVTMDVIASGLRRLLSGDLTFYPSGYDGLSELREADRTNGAEGDYDAEVADAVVQAGIFGELVYG